MTIGTKSVLYGVHCFFIHPFFIARAWIHLYGFPFDPRIWIAFFVHDLGYLGKPNMDGPEGETHPKLGAEIMEIFDILDYDFSYKNQVMTNKWYNFSLLHSRYYAKKLGMQPSKLCFADKLVSYFEPAWLYLYRANLTGELQEYMANGKNTNFPNMHDCVDPTTLKFNYDKYIKRYDIVCKLRSNDPHEWYKGLQQSMYNWVMEHKDGKVDNHTQVRHQ